MAATDPLSIAKTRFVEKQREDKTKYEEEAGDYDPSSAGSGWRSIKLGAKEWFVCPVTAGRTVQIRGLVDPGERGWSCDGRNWCGPEGHTNLPKYQESARPDLSLGTLIGGYSDTLLLEPMSHAQWVGIFKNGFRNDKRFLIELGNASKRFGAETTGWLYLIFNDVYRTYQPVGYGDNQGWIRVNIYTE